MNTGKLIYECPKNIERKRYEEELMLNGESPYLMDLILAPAPCCIPCDGMKNNGKPICAIVIDPSGTETHKPKTMRFLKKLMKAIRRHRPAYNRRTVHNEH